MAAFGIKFRMLFQDDNQAISESHYWNSTADDLATIVYPAAVKLMAARMLMMGSNVSAVSGVLSIVGALRRTFLNLSNRDVQMMTAGPTIVVTKQPAAVLAAGGANPQDGSANEANVCPILNAYSQYDEHKRIYLGGVPQVMVRENPRGPWIVGVASWNTLLQNYITLLKSAAYKWGFVGRTAPTAGAYIPVNVVSVQVQDVNGFWGIELPTYAPALPQGAQLQLRGFKMNSRAYVSFNNTFQVDHLVAGPGAGNSTYYLRGSQNVAGSQVNILGNARLVGHIIYPYSSGSIDIGGQTTHKRGNRPLAPLGRRVVRQRVSS